MGRAFGGPGLDASKFHSSEFSTGSEWGLGDIIAGVLGIAWSVATFFVIPVIIYEETSIIEGD
ncbi:MAG: hypothetical protein QXX56_03640 [Candidatus Bathyarchaeia archaeon]